MCLALTQDLVLPMSARATRTRFRANLAAVAPVNVVVVSKVVLVVLEDIKFASKILAASVGLITENAIPHYVVSVALKKFLILRISIDMTLDSFARTMAYNLASLDVP